jgi:hypothetical protein
MQTNRLDAIMPEYDFHEKHQIVINASLEKVYSAVKAVTAREILIFRALMSIRNIPAKRSFIMNADLPLLDVIYKKGFKLLADITNSEIVFGVIGQFWKMASSEEIVIKDYYDFMKYNEPVYLKATSNMRVESINGKTLLTTETRILATSSEAKRKFRIYWIIIRLGSGFIRRMWLRAIKRRAESID